MTETRRGLWRALVLVCVSALVLATSVSCASKSGSGSAGKSAAGRPALAELPTADAAVKAKYPDAKLLVVQNGSTATATKDAMWVFTYGSPTTGGMYSVSVAQGKVVAFSEDDGVAPLHPDEWASIPDTKTWEVDSDKAYDKALKASGVKGTPASFSMLMETYVPKATTDEQVKAFMWYVAFQSADSKEAPQVITVDAKSGKTETIKK